MKIALLGGTGFVGKNIAEILTENKIDFSVASRATGVDIREIDAVAGYLDQNKPDFVINCAAHVGSLNYVTEQAAEVISDNARMTLAMYEAIRKVVPESIVINPLANCVYPAKANIFIEDEWLDGPLHRSVLSYGASRRFLWEVGESYTMQHSIRSIYLLVPNMYGPHDSTDPNKAHALNALISKFVKAQHKGQSQIDIWGTGVAIREWLYAKDFGRVILQILKTPNMIGLAEPLNVGQNFGLSIKELVDIIKSNFEFKGQIKWDHSKPDGAPKKVMDDRRFRKIFSNFNFTEFNEGIRQTVKYYESVYPF